MIGFAHSKTGIISNQMPPHLLDRLEGTERADYEEVAGRSDTVTLYVEDADKGQLMAYAVVGRDADGLAVIYAARSWLTGLGAIALKSLFSAAKGAGTALRVHPSAPLRLPVETIRTYARMMGADTALQGVDADGVKMGFFA